MQSASRIRVNSGPIWGIIGQEMNVSIVYITGRFFYRIADFLRHWYVKSAYMYYDFVINALRTMDRTLAWGITARNIFEPLFGDYSVVGHIIGFLFRFVRLVGATIVYAVVFAIAIAAYLVWLAIPVFLVYKMFS